MHILIIPLISNRVIKPIGSYKLFMSDSKLCLVTTDGGDWIPLDQSSTDYQTHTDH